MPWLRRLISRPRSANEIEKELRFHLEKQTRDYVAAGMSASEASRRARMEFGGLDYVKEEIRDTRKVSVIQDCVRDMLYGLRILRKSSGFTAVAVLTLAFGIGANTAIFSVVRAVIFRPLPSPDATHLAVVLELNPDIPFRTSAGVYEFLHWKDQNHSFDSFAATDTLEGGTLTDGSDPEGVSGEGVTSDYFRVLGVPAERGRVFSSSDELPSASLVAILSHELWLRYYHADEAILNRPITLNNKKYTVIGIMPPRYGLPDSKTDVWLPLRLDRAHPSAQGYALVCIGRLKRGVSFSKAKADLETVSPWLDPKRHQRFYLKVLSLREDAAGESRMPLLVLFAAVGVVLLIACANISNLLSIRAAGRQHEFAIRGALGAGRLRLVRQMLAENFTLVAVGGSTGLLLSRWIVSILGTWIPASLKLPNASAIHIDLFVLLYSLTITLLSGFLFGVVPVLHLTDEHPQRAMKDGRGTSGGTKAGSMRSLMVVLETALSLILLAASGLLIRTLIQMEQIHLGYEPHHVLTLKFDTAFSGDFTAGPSLFEQALDRVRALPGVRSAGAIGAPPLTEKAGASAVWEAGYPRPRNSNELVLAKFWWISSGYLSTMEIPLLRGRDFDRSDRPDTTRVAIVNQTLVDHFFPGRDPVGKRLQIPGFGDPNFFVEIVGVAANTRSYKLTSAPGPEVYFANSQGPFGGGTLVIRTDSDRDGLAEAVKSEVHSVSAKLIPGTPRPMDFYVETALAKPRFSAILLSGLAVLAVALAAIGVASVTSYSVSSRINEIGIRMALGAERSAILNMVIQQGMLPVMMGIVVGLAGGLAGSRLIRGLLFGVRPLDPLTFIGVALLLALVGFGACYVPARGATRVDPIIALRHD